MGGGKRLKRGNKELRKRERGGESSKKESKQKKEWHTRDKVIKWEKW